MTSVIIVNEQELEGKKAKIHSDGDKNLHILSDFDRTVTYGLNKEGKRTNTVISQLRSDPKYLGEEYQKKAEELFAIYHPIEIDTTIPLLEKKAKMQEWWEKHFELIAKVGLTKGLIKKVVEEKPLIFRNGTLDFLDYLNEKNIPLVFLSAAPGDMLIKYLLKENMLFKNIQVISNLYEWDKEGRAIKIKEPIITSVNKDELSIINSSIYQKIKDRKNIILLGDELEDSFMAKGIDYKTIIKIGFLNEKVEENLQKFKENYDIILTGDQDFNYVNKLIRELTI